MTDLEVSAVISGALPDLVIDGANAAVYELHADTRAEKATTWRKQENEGPHVEGTFTVSAVRGNVLETLAVWCNGETTDDIELGIYELERRLSQLRYTVALTLDGVTHTWTCVSPADITTTRSREFLAAHTALVSARVVRLPRETITGAFGTRTT